LKKIGFEILEENELDHAKIPEQQEQQQQSQEQQNGGV